MDKEKVFDPEKADKEFSREITDINEIREQNFLVPHEVGRILRIGDNTLYEFLASPDCPFPVLRLSKQIVRIPAQKFFEWCEGDTK